MGSPEPATASTALLTDHYELTMLGSALADGTAERPCVFEVFARRLPDGRRYGVVAGTARVLDAIADFRFTDAELAQLEATAVVDDATLAWLADYEFSGDVDGYPEGELYFPGSPLLTVTGTFAECVLLETLVLSILNHDSAIASAAARMVRRRARPADHRDGRAPHARVRRRRRGPRRLPGRLRDDVEPRSRAPLRHPDRAAPSRTPSCCCTTAKRRRSARRSRSWARTRRCWSTPTTSPPASRPRSRVAGPGAGRDPDRLGRRRPARPPRPRAAGLPRRQGHPDRRLRRPRRARHRGAARGARGRVRRRHVGGHRVRRADRRHGLQAGRGGRQAGRQAQRAQGVPRRPQVRAAAPPRHRHGGRRGRLDRGRRRARAGGERPRAADPADPRLAARRRTCLRSTTPGNGCAAAWSACRGRASSSRTASPLSRRCFSERRPDDHGNRADRGGRAERLLRRGFARPCRAARPPRPTISALAARRRLRATWWPPATTTSTRAPTSARRPTSRTAGRCTAWPARRARRSTRRSTSSRSARCSPRASTAPAYSGFEGASRGRQVPGGRGCASTTSTDVDVVGIATDYCVRATALDAAKAGLRRARAARPDGRRLAAASVDATLRDFDEAGVTYSGKAHVA